jgi:uncharacterized protein (TIGR02284 family)
MPTTRKTKTTRGNKPRARVGATNSTRSKAAPTKSARQDPKSRTRSQKRPARRGPVGFDTRTLVAELNNLIQMDYDAIRGYDQATRSIRSARVQEKLELFRTDHERHVTDLSAAVTRLGGVPARNADMVGFLIQGFTAISSAAWGGLRAMQSNEMVTNTTYGGALNLARPPEIRRVVRKNYQDEKRHLEWIEREIYKPADIAAA